MVNVMSSIFEHPIPGLQLSAVRKICKDETIGAHYGSQVFTDHSTQSLLMKQYDDRTIAVSISILRGCTKRLPPPRLIFVASNIRVVY